MATKGQKRKNRRKRAPASKESTAGFVDSSDGNVAQASQDNHQTGTQQQPTRPRILVQAIRAGGILPIGLLVMLLSTHHLYPTPHWFEPISDKQAAVLTLSAGHAGIIGLLINNGGRFTWSTYALLIAAVATALAGYRTIGESPVGQVTAVTLALLTIPAVWAEYIDTKARRTWNFGRSKKGFLILLLAVGIILAAYNQYQNEHYLRNWILIPLGIFLGCMASVHILWLLFNLCSRSFKDIKHRR